MKYLEGLSEQETGLLLKTPALVTILIAGADDEIDKKEKSWASKLVKYRTFTSDVKLHAYYETVHDRFEDDLNELESTWDHDATEAQIIEQLKGLNPILAKIETEYADLLKQSWRSLSHKVAEASGGILGFGSVNPDESRLVDLPMID